LRRQPSGVELTAFGQILFEAIARSFSDIENALREIEARRSGLETVSLSLSTGFTTHWMMLRMVMFKKQFSSVDLRFQLTMGALIGSVNDVDLGMRFVSGSDAQHEAAFIMPEILIPVCSPSHCVDHDPAGSSVNRLPDTLINLSDAEPDCSYLLIPESQGDDVNFMVFSDYAIVVQAALIGQGVALGWLNVVAHWLRNRSLIPVGE